MKYPAYPSYKPSGVEWLGDVPTSWHEKRLKYVASINDDALPETTNPDFELSYVDISGVSASQGILSTEDLLFAKAPSRARRVVRDGDTIVSTVRTYLRAITPIRHPAPNLIVSTGFAVIRPQYIEAGYLAYALQDARFVETVVAMSVGVSYPACNASDVATIPVLVPSPTEQRAIADFLDSATAKIDALVTKKRSLIDKLKEKRAALISRAVTRGLPPDAAHAAGLNPYPALKPSGIEWIGDVPTHWDTGQIRRSMKYITSGSRGWAEYYADEGKDFLRIGNLTRESIAVDMGDIQRVSLPPSVEGERAEVQSGDMLLSITAYLGSVAIACEHNTGSYISQHIALVRLDQERLFPKYAGYAVLGDVGQSQLTGSAYGGTKVQLSLDDVKSIYLPLPPLPEQGAIAAYLDSETDAIDQMIAKIQTAIDRLQEYRAALISAAVTGKIDVRGALDGG